MTKAELIALLTDVPPDYVVAVEGCDCEEDSGDEVVVAGPGIDVSYKVLSGSCTLRGGPAGRVLVRRPQGQR